MKLNYITVVVAVMLVFAFTVSTGAADTNNQTSDDIKEYDGPIGSDNVAYGLKLGLQNLDEAFTFNESDKLAKKIAHLEERIAEYKAASAKKNEKAALIALDIYDEKMKDIEDSISNNSNADMKTGLLNAVQRIQRHKFILENLTNRNPNNPGLKRAYENSNKHLINFASKHHIDVENLTFEDDEHDKLKDSKENLTLAKEIRGNESEDHGNVTSSEKEIQNQDLKQKEEITSKKEDLKQKEKIKGEKGHQNGKD
jgi:hypothetical protein